MLELQLLWLSILRSTSFAAPSTASSDSTDKYKLEGFQLNTSMADMFGFTDLS